MLSSDFCAGSMGRFELSGGASGRGAWLAAVAPPVRGDASGGAGDCGTGELAGAVAAAAFGAEVEGGGTAGGAGSLARGAVTEVSPVNGFLYSLAEVMTSSDVGL